MVHEGIMGQFGISQVFGMQACILSRVLISAIRHLHRPNRGFTGRLRYNGRGGHAAEPSRNIDPVVIGARRILGLQCLVSRKTDPNRIAGDFGHETSFNIIPMPLKSPEPSGPFHQV